MAFSSVSSSSHLPPLPFPWPQAAIRTERDAVGITGREVLFHRTIRQTINVHELQEQVMNTVLHVLL